MQRTDAQRRVVTGQGQDQNVGLQHGPSEVQIFAMIFSKQEIIVVTLFISQLCVLCSVGIRGFIYNSEVEQPPLL